MASGRLRCFGSPLYLKSHYGVGYHLTIEKTSYVPTIRTIGTVVEPAGCTCFDNDPVVIHEEQEPTDCSSRLHRTVVKYIPQACLLTNTNAEMVFHLPLSSMRDFIRLLKKLDKEIGQGRASSYGLNITTLDQVFLKVSRGEEPEPAAVELSESSMGALTDLTSSLAHDTQTSASSNSSVTMQLQEANPSGAMQPPDDVSLDYASDLLVIRNMVESNERVLFWVQMRALLRKRQVLFRRDKKTVLFTVLVPLLVTFIGFLLTKLVSKRSVPSDLLLSVNMLRASGIDVVPVVTNAGGGAPFLCQPGLCSVDGVIFDHDIVNEAYVMCGYESRLITSLQNLTPTSDTCTLKGLSDIVSSMPEPLQVIRIDARNVTEVSHYFVSSDNSNHST
jgi:ATP-binding cassette, subfamily A (ABC1), member 3